MIHSVLLNRSTLYSQKASKAFGAMFDEIKKRARALRRTDSSRFVFKSDQKLFHAIPDNHSVGRRIYVKAKAEKSWRFLRQGFGWKRWSRRWMYATVGLFDYRVRYLVDSPKDAPAR